MRAALAATLVMTTAFLSGTAARAPAADLAAANPKMVVKTPPPPAPLSGWSGWYVGANAGGDWGRSRSTTTVGGSALNPSFAPFALTVFNAIGSPAAFNTHGFTGGVHGGYNYVSGQWLVGVEGDLEAFRSAGSTSATGALFAPTTGSVPVTLTSAMSTDWLLTVRPRAGIVVNDWLVFATGGLAVTQLRPSWTTAVVVQTEQATASSIKAGWVVGGGVERTRLWGPSPIRSPTARTWQRISCGRASASCSDETTGAMRAFYRWATTPPQAYVIYAILVVAVGGLSFLAGTLKPKRTPALAPAARSQPNH